MSGKSFIRGAAILGAAGILVKILGAIYQIPFINIIGPQGSAYYSPAYYIYTIFIVIATSGIPVAISRLVSERIIVQNFEEAHRVFHLSFYLMAGIGILSFLVMFFCADAIAVHITNVPKSALAMRTIAPALIVVPVMAAFRGYYQGQQNMKPTAISQIVEQVVRVIFGLTLAYVLYHGVIGIFGTHNAGERGAAGGAFGATAGSIGGLIVMLLVYRADRGNIHHRMENTSRENRESDRELMKKILWISVPITLGACIVPVMSYLDAPLVVSRMTSVGYSRDVAETVYGEISGFIMPLVNLPQVLAGALAMSLVPLISSAFRARDQKTLQENTSLAVRVAVMIGFPCAAGMAILAEPILLLLYSSHAQDASHASTAFALYAAGIVFTTIIQTVSGILQGVGKQLIPVRNMLIGVVLKIGLTWWLVGIPGMDIKGAGIGTLATYCLVTVMNMAAVRKYTGADIDIRLTYFRPFLATLAMVVVAWVLYYGIFFHGGPGQVNKVGCIIAVLVAACVYGVMLLVTRSIGRKDLESFGVGRKILNRLERRGIRL